VTSRRRDPLPLGDVLKGILERLGVGDLNQWQKIQDEWVEVAPSPWDRQSRPVALSDGVLVVEAVSPAAVGILRYGVTGLEQRMAERYGEGVVREVKLRSPGPRRQQ
jgi:hypothetical protein